MDTIVYLFGEEGNLNCLQMGCRAFVIFLLTLIMIRIAGRRSFGIKAPFDNILMILLGAILSRAVVGASPFFPTIVASLALCVFHRILGLLSFIFPSFESLIKGDKIILYENKKFIKKNLLRSLATEEDILEEVRLKGNVESFDKLIAVYMERNGEISSVKKE